MITRTPVHCPSVWSASYVNFKVTIYYLPNYALHHENVWRSRGKAPCFPNLRTLWSCEHNLVPRSLYSRGNNPGCPLDMCLDTAQCRSGYTGVEEDRTPVVQPIDVYCPDRAIMGHHWVLVMHYNVIVHFWKPWKTCRMTWRTHQPAGKRSVVFTNDHSLAPAVKWTQMFRAAPSVPGGRMRFRFLLGSYSPVVLNLCETAAR